MVSKGQFSERPTLIPSGSVVLEGLWHRGDRRPPLLIIPPMPTEGSGMDHVMVAEVAWAAAMAGFPSIRFNFRGVGASQGRSTGVESCNEDIESAAQLLCENTATARIARLFVGAWGSRPAPTLLASAAAPLQRVIPIDGAGTENLPQLGRKVTGWLDSLEAALVDSPRGA